MQIISVKEIRPVKSKSGKEFFVVVDEKGAEFTTFDKALQQVTPGSLLAIEPKVDGKYVNIESWEIKEKAEKAAPGSNHYGKSPEELDLSRHSFALSYAKDLVVAGKVEVGDILSKATEFYQWLKGGQEVLKPKEGPEAKEKRDWNWFWTQLRNMGVDSQKAHSILGVASLKDDWVGKGKTLDAAMATIKVALAKEKPSPLKGEEIAKDDVAWEDLPQTEKTPKRDPSSIKNIEALKHACKEDFGLEEPTIFAELNIGSWMEIFSLSDAYRTIAAARQ